VRGQRHVPAPFYPRERPGTHCTGGWVGGPQDRSVQVRKISTPPGFDPQTVQPVASRYTDWAIPAHALTLFVTYCFYAVTMVALSHVRMCNTTRYEKWTGFSPMTVVVTGRHQQILIVLIPRSTLITHKVAVVLWTNYTIRSHTVQNFCAGRSKLLKYIITSRILITESLASTVNKQRLNSTRVFNPRTPTSTGFYSPTYISCVCCFSFRLFIFDVTS
jgi:hypothetical protein